MVSSYTKCLLLGWAGRRTTRGTVCNVRESRRVGGETDPGVHVTVVVENPQGENAFVDSIQGIAAAGRGGFRRRGRSLPA